MLETLVPVSVGVVLGGVVTYVSNRSLQMLAFDHRFRLEREYELCVDLWETLFELRRRVGQLASAGSDSTSVTYSNNEILEAFNAYQAVVRKSEQFLSPAVYKPSREIVTLARNIMHAYGAEREIAERRSDKNTYEDGDRLAAKRMELYEGRNTAFAEIEERFQQIAKAIRYCVRPR